MNDPRRGQTFTIRGQAYFESSFKVNNFILIIIIYSTIIQVEFRGSGGNVFSQKNGANCVRRGLRAQTQLFQGRNEDQKISSWLVFFQYLLLGLSKIVFDFCSALLQRT